MGRPNSDFAPLDPERAKELEFIIDSAAKDKQAVVIDADRGVVRTQTASLISPASNTNGLVRYGTHYRPKAW